MSFKYGDSGPQIGRIQQDLLEAGESFDSGELTTAIFGDSTRAALERFQAHHVDHTGKPLVVDGVAGTETLWALAFPGADNTYVIQGWQCDITCPEVSAANSDIGKHEEPDGSNDGPYLKKFHTYGQPWCALALSEWYREGAVARNETQGAWGVLASAAGVLAWGKNNSKVVDLSAAVMPGDCFIIVRASGHGHCGLICEVDKATGDLFTIEGNCSNAVRGGRRPRSLVTAVIRPR